MIKLMPFIVPISTKINKLEECKKCLKTIRTYILHHKI